MMFLWPKNLAIPYPRTVQLEEIKVVTEKSDDMRTSKTADIVESGNQDTLRYPLNMPNTSRHRLALPNLMLTLKKEFLLMLL